MDTNRLTIENKAKILVSIILFFIILIFIVLYNLDKSGKIRELMTVRYDTKSPETVALNKPSQTASGNISIPSKPTPAPEPPSRPSENISSVPPSPSPTPPSTPPPPSQYQTDVCGDLLPSLPSFQWKNHLEDITSGQTDKCLWTIDSQTLLRRLGSLVHENLMGYDFLPEVDFIRIYPLGKLEKELPHMEFYFHSNKLGRIELVYYSKYSVEKSLFEEELGNCYSSNIVDRSVCRWTLGTSVIEYISKSKALSLRFESKEFHDQFKTYEENIRRAIGYFSKGRNLLIQEKLDESEQNLKSAIQLVPAYGNSWARLAQTYLEKESITDAENAVSKYIEVTRQNDVRAVALFVRAQIKFVKDDTNGALSDLEEAMRLAPENEALSPLYKAIKENEFSESYFKSVFSKIYCAYTANNENLLKIRLRKFGYATTDTWLSLWEKYPQIAEKLKSSTKCQ